MKGLVIITHPVAFPSTLYGFIFTSSIHNILGTVRRENKYQTGGMKEGNVAAFE